MRDGKGALCCNSPKQERSASSAVVMLLIALYAVAGFVLAPKLLRSTLMKEIPRTLGATPTVGEIHVNPFPVPGRNQGLFAGLGGRRELLGFERLFVDFELSSIWHRAYSFADIDHCRTVRERVGGGGWFPQSAASFSPNPRRPRLRRPRPRKKPNRCPRCASAPSR